MYKAYERLLEIANKMANDPNCIAVVGLGSMAELERMDEFSDIDFFLIVENNKQPYIDDLNWLALTNIAYQFKNCDVGYKLLYDDGVFVEMAVFDYEEAQKIFVPKPNYVYLKEGYKPFFSNIPDPKYPKEALFYLNEGLTNIYVGLGRELRGEYISATTFIQTYAVNNAMHLLKFIYPEVSYFEDYYVYERRIEQRFPQAKEALLKMKQGCMKNAESAEAIMAFYTEHFNVNETLRLKIEELIKRCKNEK